MEDDVPQPSTVPHVEDMDASHARNDSLVTVRLSEPVQLKADTQFQTKDELLDPFHMEADTLAGEKEGLSERAPSQVGTQFEKEEKSPVDEPDEEHDSTLPEDISITEDVEEKEQVTEQITDRSLEDLRTVKAEAQSPAAELGTERPSTSDSMEGLSVFEKLRLARAAGADAISTRSSIRAESTNLATESDAKDVPTVKAEPQSLAAESATDRSSNTDSRRDSAKLDISTTEAEAPNLATELEVEELPATKAEEQSLAAELATDRLSNADSISNISTIKAEAPNLATELDAEELPTANAEEQSLAAELATDRLSTSDSEEDNAISNISTIKAEAPNLTTELDAEELPTVESKRASNISTIKADAEEQTLAAGLEVEDSSTPPSRRESNDSQDGEVNWAELQKNEAEEPKDQESDDSTALLLARLEQENNSIATNPKSAVGPTLPPGTTRARAQSRPPSMQQLKNMVEHPPPAMPALRYSHIPAPPPMTDLEFYAALVRDYPKTLRKLPTLVSKKIRGGVPPPLRGVVWQSMAGSRDPALEEQYELLSGETSPYEGAIGKDLGRSFPGVEMFRDPDGDGQRMLGKVLKTFSLYDQKIGYCQGLGFLVGPLLMHMPDKEAFCILVKLMEQYDLRNCFLPDLSGLHVRIYQFRELLKQHIPDVSAHLELMQIEPAYVSQWFLSFFAVTCPLPMLFRIFDVIFAEGASETLMRVALSLMRKNEAKILACTELEDVMQLLLSRGLWDCYHSNADELVNDFVTFSGLVTHETLQTLAIAYEDSRTEVRTSDIGSVATRFLGRLWTGSTASSKSTPSLSPGLSAPSRPKSFLRRSASKQSIASTLDSIEGGSDSIMSMSTDATTISRDSSNTDKSSLRTQSVSGNNARKTMMSTMSKQDIDLHGQIEDLLTAMSELQRETAELDTRLQREKEEREEDKVTVRALLCGLTRKSRMEALRMVEGDNSVGETDVKASTEIKDFASLAEDNVNPGIPEGVDPSAYITAEELNSLLDVVEERFQTDRDERRSSIIQSKTQLRDELTRSKEQLDNEMSKAKDLAQRLATEEQEVANLREQIRESHAHIRNAHSERSRLERQVSEMRQAARSREKSPTTSPDGSDVDGWSGRSSTWSSGSGLRELKLGRSNSGKSTRTTGTTFSKRTSSLINPQTTVDKREREHENTSSISSVDSTPNTPAIPDNDALILELVAAKTAKVIAEEELEEMRVRLDSLTKMMSMNGENAGNTPAPSVEKAAAPGFMSYMTGTASTSSAETKSIRSVSTAPLATPTIVATPPSKESTPEPKAATPAPAAGWFGGWGKKA